MGGSDIGAEVLTPKYEGAPELEEIQPGVVLEISRRLGTKGFHVCEFALVQSRPIPREGGGLSVLMLVASVHSRKSTAPQASWSWAKTESYDLSEMGIIAYSDDSYDHDCRCRRVSID